MKADAVNIAVHGHNPVLSEVIAGRGRAAERRGQGRGRSRQGINLVGICCTGHEVMMRHGIPYATNSAVAGAGDRDRRAGRHRGRLPVHHAQPAARWRSSYHTAIITTMPIAKIPGATHIEFDEAHAGENAQQILRAGDRGVQDTATRRRSTSRRWSTRRGRACRPRRSSRCWRWWIPDDPLKPLIDNIVNGNILGVCLFAGCNDVKVTQDKNFVDADQGTGCRRTC